MTINDINMCLGVVAYYNPNMKTLYDTFSSYVRTIGNFSAGVKQAEENDELIYEHLVKTDIKLANAIHDFVWNVVRPFDSIMVKNTIQEQVCRDIFGLEAHF